MWHLNYSHAYHCLLYERFDDIWSHNPNQEKSKFTKAKRLDSDYVHYLCTGCMCAVKLASDIGTNRQTPSPGSSRKYSPTILNPPTVPRFPKNPLFPMAIGQHYQYAMRGRCTQLVVNVTMHGLLGSNQSLSQFSYHAARSRRSVGRSHWQIN